MKLILPLLFSTAFPHSWIVCTDYTEKNGRYFSHDKCRGYPRNGHAKVSGTFGQDTGYDHRPGTSGNACPSSRDDQTMYNANFPMAVYYPGQQVILAHPMKNHGAEAGATNIWIPDNGNFIWRGNLNDDHKVDYDMAHYRQNLVSDLGKSKTGMELGEEGSKIYPKPGYQNAPAFSEDTDKAMGTYSFNIPENLAPGRYTFVWEWRFNSEQDVYSSCFEVDVVPSKTERDNRLQARGVTDLYVACGGILSNEGVGSEIGCRNEPVTTSDPTTDAPVTTPAPTTIRTTTGRSTTTQLIQSTDASTTDASTTSTTQKPAQPGTPQKAHVLATSLQGYIKLPNYTNLGLKRTIKVQFGCPGVVANFWLAKQVALEITDDEVIYTLEQTWPTDIVRGRIGFYASFNDSSCDLLAYPVISSVIDG